MQVNFRGRRWLMQFPPAPPFSLCKVCEADSSLCVCACVYLCIYVHSTHASYVEMHQCGSRNIKALLFSNVLADLLIFIFWCLHFVGMSSWICWFLHVGQTGKSHVNTVLIKKPAVLDHAFRPQQAKYTSTSSEFEFRPYFSGSAEQKWRRSHDIRKFCNENYGPEAAATSAATANFHSTRKQTSIQHESNEKTSKNLRVRMCARANTLRADIQDT